MIRLPLLGLIVIALALVTPQRTPGDGRRDLWPGIATNVDILSTRRPGYRFSYVFVTRADQPLTGLTLDDRRPRSLRIGLQMVGNDAMNSRPSPATARRALARNVNVQGAMHHGNYDWSTPPAGNVNALVTAGSLLRWNGGL
jgi:mxaJ protein